MTPRAITGLGIACTLGVGAEAFFRAMNAAPSRLSQRPPGPIASFDASKYDARTLPIVEVPDGADALQTLLVAQRTAERERRVRRIGDQPSGAHDVGHLVQRPGLRVLRVHVEVAGHCGSLAASR